MIDTAADLQAARAAVLKRIASLIVILQGDLHMHKDVIRQMADHLREGLNHADAQMKNGHFRLAFETLKGLL